MKVNIKPGAWLAGLALICMLLSGWGLPIEADELDNAEDTEAEASVIARENLQDFDISGLAYYEQARRLITKVNELRASLDLEPLVYNMQLEDLAFLRAAETSVYWSHTRPDGSRLIDTNPDIAAENLQGGVGNADQVFDNWLHSEGHYENMVNPEFKSIGVAAYSSLQGEAPRWWAQLFSTNLPENNIPDRQDRTAISHRIGLDPGLLHFEILTGEQIAAGVSSEDFYQGEVLRLPLDDRKQLFGMVHYDLEDVYAAPGSIAAEELVWEISDSQVASLQANGELKTLAPGNATIRVHHASLPELQTTIELEVIPTYKLELLAAFSAEKTAALLTRAQESYAVLPSVENYVGESTPEANRQKEQTYRFYEQVEADSNLQRLAFEMAKQYSLFMSADSMESLPDFTRILEDLPAGRRVSWHAFSNLDSPEEQTVRVPGWVKSVGTVVLESAGSEISVLLYSDQDADGRVLAYEDLVAAEDRQDPAAASFSYAVNYFADRSDFSLCFVDQGLVVSQIDVYDPLDYRFSRNERDQLIYEPQILLQRDEPGPYPGVNVDPSSVQYSLDDPRIAAFTGDGKVLIKAQGSFTLHVDLLDPVTQESICQGELLINNYVTIPEYELPEATVVPEVSTAPLAEDPAEAGEGIADQSSPIELDPAESWPLEETTPTEAELPLEKQ